MLSFGLVALGYTLSFYAAMSGDWWLVAIGAALIARGFCRFVRRHRESEDRTRAMRADTAATLQRVIGGEP